MVFKRRDKRTWWQAISDFVWPKGGWARAFHYVKHRLRRLPDPPHRIARGIFAGIFVTFFTVFRAALFAGRDRGLGDARQYRGVASGHVLWQPADIPAHRGRCRSIPVIGCWA